MSETNPTMLNIRNLIRQCILLSFCIIRYKLQSLFLFLIHVLTLPFSINDIPDINVIVTCELHQNTVDPA